MAVWSKDILCLSAEEYFYKWTQQTSEIFPKIWRETLYHNAAI